MQHRAVLAPALMLAAIATLSACASDPATAPRPAVARPGPAKPVTPPPTPFALTPAAFRDIPGWAQADMAPALTAFRRQCDLWKRRTPDAMTTGGQYGGPVGDWFPACDAATTIQPGQERWFFESYFQPSIVSGPGEQRLTSYFEPIIEARRALEPGFTEPLLRRPNDMLTVDLGAFAEAYDSEALRGAPRSLTGKLVGNKIEPYPKRNAIAPAPEQIIAWAHPADVYNLQVQGSGRMRFPDGAQARAQFAAQNGYKWNSALGALRSAGRLATATWASFREFLDTNPSESTPTLNADPSYVFFQEEQIIDYAAGPKGAAGISLTPMGSLAVDPAYHPYGAVIFVDGVHDGYAFQRLMVAQDTGGAIRRGPQRGDVFAGSGPEAGAFAEKMNGPARWWTLLPIKFSNAPVASLPTTGAKPG